MTSKLVTLNAAGDAATVADAEISDIFMTAFSTNKSLTGTYALAQRGVIFVSGMAFQNYRLTGRVNPFSS
jgi:hypothetical protein